MLICIENLIDEATFEHLRSWMSTAIFEDGRATAGGNARLVKFNEQVSGDSKHPEPKLEEMQALVSKAIWNNALFYRAS